MTDKNVPYEDQQCGDQSFSNRESVEQVLASARIEGYTPSLQVAALFEDLATGRKTGDEICAEILAAAMKREAKREIFGLAPLPTSQDASINPVA